MAKQEPQINRFSWAIRASPVLAALILAALWIAGVPSPVPDLRFSAPVVARPGSTVGLRAWQLDEDDEGYTVVDSPPVVVELRNAAGMPLARTELRASLVHGREGELSIPTGLDETLSLVALADIDGQEVSVTRSLYVRGGITSRLPSGRSVTAFQAYELGPIRLLDSRRDVELLDPRAEEGACVPDLRCMLSVWVGDDDLRVRLRSIVGVQTDPDAVLPSNGFARFPIVVSGTEGRIDVEGLDPNGAVLAAREVRLPLVPGGIVARASARADRVHVDWQQLGERGAVLVDVFEGRRWVRALSLSPDDPYLSAPGPGVWRLQIRADLFSDNTAGVTSFVVDDPAGPDRARAAAAAVLENARRRGLDPLALTILDGALPEAAGDDAIRALFAVPNFEVVALGSGMSSRLGVDEDLELAQERRRWQAAAVILLIGVIVGAFLLRVELAARARARRLLDALGDGGSEQRPGSFSGGGLWAFVLLIFVLMAVLALSKRWF
ncbi:MAG: hypothetical protein HKP36_12025 [Myxococcales bacterium]|nr:hypothetical protein [Deltaproteobacteria bacterium]NNK42912.1 hypothetical protein [Myxococcales bacterium]NNL25167.1 hypothetical protein [Myxococcales bacterium]